ncbi:purine deaminase [Naegleria gruberi]|uniref:Purine deaminase n=1 Tax=Naegleria gruberi TaxID=5762 RepID=D2V985_NAEGR|nr:purine deaminase [Naegleria gruberi]EFC46667.1 purine deaminase [Naegleria gruberi]|eukprot:XP_002679411.1 purine deaminase [Naegleria gruberi strain NEG-M]
MSTTQTITTSTTTETTPQELVTTIRCCSGCSSQQSDEQKHLHEKLMKRAIDLSKESCNDHGNHPFGALLIDNDTNEIILEAHNTVHTENDRTRHAELNLSSMASKKYPRDYLTNCTMYTSTEPCIMCAGAIFWVGIGKVVYACPASRLREIVRRKQDGNNLKNSGSLTIACREIFEERSEGLNIPLIGPIMEEEAAAVHESYW